VRAIGRYAGSALCRHLGQKFVGANKIDLGLIRSMRVLWSRIVADGGAVQPFAALPLQVMGLRSVPRPWTPQRALLGIPDHRDQRFRSIVTGHFGPS
jgi:hypothetical protein